MAANFSGEYHHSLDSKGRLIIPSRFRDLLGGKFMIGKGLDECLVIYDMDDWEAFSEKLKALPYNSAKNRALVRYFQSGTMEVEIDRQGRILLPQQLRDKAGIKKDVVFVGNGSRAELWSEEAYSGYTQEFTEESISGIAEELLGTGWQI